MDEVIVVSVTLSTFPFISRPAGYKYDDNDDAPSPSSQESLKTHFPALSL